MAAAGLAAGDGVFFAEAGWCATFVQGQGLAHWNSRWKKDCRSGDGVPQTHDRLQHGLHGLQQGLHGGGQRRHVPGARWPTVPAAVGTKRGCGAALGVPVCTLALRAGGCFTTFVLLDVWGCGLPRTADFEGTAPADGLGLRAVTTRGLLTGGAGFGAAVLGTGATAGF